MTPDDDDLGRLIVGSRRRKREQQQRKREARRARWGFVVIALIAVIAAVVVGAALATASFVDDLPDLENQKAAAFGENSAIYAIDPQGRQKRLGVIAADENRSRVRWKKISPWLRNATVAIEDRRFWTHDGVDYEGIGRAAWRNLTSGQIVEGASTITQQVVRNVYLQDVATERTFRRKIDEAWLALQLEDEMSKADILTTYLNTVFYGHNAYGAEAAARTFFNKPASKLNLPEAALIAGLPQAPSSYDPLAKGNEDVALRRRNEVLDAMWNLGYVKNRERYEWAKSSGLGLHPGTLYEAVKEKLFFGFVRKQLEDKFGADAVKKGGYKVTTTLDTRMQFAASRAVKSVLKTEGGPRAAIVALDPRNGYVKAMWSSVTASTTNFNFATQGARQPGSTFKMIALVTAISNGISPSTPWVSAPLRCTYETCGTDWDVDTYDRSSRGTLSLARATLSSDNTVYARLSLALRDAYGADAQVKMARRLGITTSKLQPFESIVLGAQEVTPLELTSAYATLASGGIYYRPRAVREVLNSDGLPAWEFKQAKRRAIPDWVAAETTNILEQNAFSGTGTRAVTADRRPQAGKTGTAEDFGNAWYCGYTPQLAACVWIGYPQGNIPLYNVEGVGAVAGGTLPAQIWKNFMDVALAKIPPAEFPVAKHASEFLPFSSKWETFQAPPPPPPPEPEKKPDETTTDPDTTDPGAEVPTDPSVPPPVDAPPADTGDADG